MSPSPRHRRSASLTALLILAAGCAPWPRTPLRSWYQEPDADYVQGPEVPGVALVAELEGGARHVAVVASAQPATCDGFVGLLDRLDALEAEAREGVTPDEDGAWLCDQVRRAVADAFGPDSALTAIHLLAGAGDSLTPGDVDGDGTFVAAGWESGPAGASFGRAAVDRCAARMPDALVASLPYPITAALPRLRNPSDPWMFTVDGEPDRPLGVDGPLDGDAVSLTLGLQWSSPDGGHLALLTGDDPLPVEPCPGLARHTDRFWAGR